MKQKKLWVIAAILTICGTMTVQAQVMKDAQKRTCAKALVMTHAYSNAIIDKVEEALRSGIVGNENDDW